MAHGAPDYHQNVLMMGNDGVNNKQIYVNEDGKIITLIQGKYNDSDKTVAVDSEGNLITLIQGQCEGSPQTIAVNASGEMSIKAYGSAALEPELIIAQKVDDIDVVAETNSLAYSEETDDYIYGNGSLRIQTSYIEGMYVDFVDATKDLHRYRYFSMVAKAITRDINVTVFMYCSDGSYFAFWHNIKQDWDTYTMDILNPDVTGGTPDIGNFKYFKVFCSIDSAVQDILIDDFMCSHNDLFVDESQLVRLTKNGAYMMELTGLYNDHNRPVTVTANDNLQIDIAEQTGPHINVKPYHHESNIVYSTSDNVADNSYILRRTGFDGKCQGGFISVDFPDGTANYTACYFIFVINSLYKTGIPVSELLNCGLDQPEHYMYYLIKDTEASKSFTLGISPGLTWVNNLDIIYRSGTADNNPTIGHGFSYIEL